METKIKPELIAVGEPQKIVADLQPFSKAKEQVGLTIAELNKWCVIYDAAQLADAMEVLKIASKVEKAIESKRKDLVKPFNDGSGAINAHAKEITAGLPAAIEIVKKAVLQYQKDEEEKALQLKKQARIKQLEEMGFVLNETEKRYENGDVLVLVSSLVWGDFNWGNLISNTTLALQEQEATKNQALQVEDPELYDLLGLGDEVEEPVAVLPAPSAKFFAPTALKGATKVWKFKITDYNYIPEEYWVVDEVAIRKAVMSGTREIPGVEIYQEDTLRIR